MDRTTPVADRTAATPAAAEWRPCALLPGGAHGSMWGTTAPGARPAYGRTARSRSGQRATEQRPQSPHDHRGPGTDRAARSRAPRRPPQTPMAATTPPDPAARRLDGLAAYGRPWRREIESLRRVRTAARRRTRLPPRRRSPLDRHHRPHPRRRRHLHVRRPRRHPQRRPRRETRPSPRRHGDPLAQRQPGQTLRQPQPRRRRASSRGRQLVRPRRHTRPHRARTAPHRGHPSRGPSVDPQRTTARAARLGQRREAGTEIRAPGRSCLAYPGP
jgi:filamentous hemagglutinin